MWEGTAHCLDCHPCAGGPGLYKKASWEATESEPISHVPRGSVSSPLWVSALTFLNDRLCYDVEARSTLPPSPGNSLLVRSKPGQMRICGWEHNPTATQLRLCFGVCPGTQFCAYLVCCLLQLSIPMLIWSLTLRINEPDFCLFSALWWLESASA